MVDLNPGELRQILEIVEGSQFDFLELKVGDLHLTVSKSPIGSVPGVAAPPAPGRDTAPAAPTAPLPPATPPPAAPVPRSEPRPPSTPSRASAEVNVDGLVPVRAPMVGTFYAQPEPESPPYVDVGSPITEESALGLIEVMKVYTQVYAGVRGIVDQILVKNAEFIEFGQVLFLVRPDEPTTERPA